MAREARARIELPSPGAGGRLDWLWQHLGGLRGVGLRLAFVVLTLAAASQHVIRGDSLIVLLVIALPGALLATRGTVPLAIYAAAWFAFSLVRAGMNDLGLPDQGATVAAVDRLLGGGWTPTERLQNAFYRPGTLGAIDVAAVWTHTSYYVTPHLAALALWWHGRRIGDQRLFDRYLRASLMLMLLGLLLYALLPTAPPWIQGTRDDEMVVHRITRVSNAGETRDPDQVYTFFTDPNPVAAMPSLHEAFTVMLALVLLTGPHRLRWLGLVAALHSAMMAFALVYLGEHYLIDVLVGAVLAGGVVVFVVRHERKSMGLRVPGRLHRLLN